MNILYYCIIVCIIWIIYLHEMYTRLRTYTIQWKQGKGLFPINIIIIIIHKNINFNVFISNLFI
ncbi:hypothetical protein DERP_004302, partial [Dermatophagoides pteronyssinus]